MAKKFSFLTVELTHVIYENTKYDFFLIREYNQY